MKYLITFLNFKKYCIHGIWAKNNIDIICQHKGNKKNPCTEQNCPIIKELEVTK